MKAIDKHFNPQVQFGQALTEFENKLQALMADATRLQWLKGKVEADLEAKRDAADTLEVFDEQQAADLLGIKLDLLRRLRRRHCLPHVIFGTHVRYTKDNLRAVCEVMTINGGAGRQERKAA